MNIRALGTMNIRALGTMNIRALGTMNIRAIVVVATVLAFSTPAQSAIPAHSSDTTWIEGTVTSVTKRPIRVAHAILFAPEGRAPLGIASAQDAAQSQLAIATADTSGRFRLATTEKGQLLLRIVTPDHAPVERFVLCSGGHTIRLAAVAATQFTPSDVWNTVSIIVGDATIKLKRTGKGLYGANVKTTDTIVRYYVRSMLVGTHLPTFSNGTQNSDSTPDDRGMYWSMGRASKGIARIVVNTKAWPRSNTPSTITFLSIDDATLDTLITRIDVPGSRAFPISPQPSESNTQPAPQHFGDYADRGYRVREVAALAYNVSWDTLKRVVPPRSMAWTIGQQKFFDVLMQTGTNPEIRDYIDTILTKHPVRRIIPPLQAAAIAYAKYSADLERTKRLLTDMMHEFPNHERTHDVRRFTDPDRPIQVNRVMPDFDWTSADRIRRRITSASLIGVHTLFFAWDSHVHDTAMFDDIRRVYATYKADGLHVVSIFAGPEGKGAPAPSLQGRDAPAPSLQGRDASTPSLPSFIKTHPWPTLYSDGSPLSPAVVLDNRVPFMVLVGPDRMIITISGGLGGIELDKTLARLLRK